MKLCCRLLFCKRWIGFKNTILFIRIVIALLTWYFLKLINMHLFNYLLIIWVYIIIFNFFYWVNWILLKLLLLSLNIFKNRFFELAVHLIHVELTLMLVFGHSVISSKILNNIYLRNIQIYLNLPINIKIIN